MDKKTTNVCKSLLVFVGLVLCQPAVQATEHWETIDKALKPKVYQLNVGIKITVGNNLHAHLADLSPKYHLPVFSTSNIDRGFHIISFGSTFPINSTKPGKTYFLTNRHVVNAGDNLIREAERFFAAMKLYAQENHGWTDPEKKFQDICKVVNLSSKQDMNPAEKLLYASTVDAIWDTYEKKLSVKADPQRQLFNKYLSLVKVKNRTAYLLHKPGPANLGSINAELYKISKPDSDTDLAILGVEQNLPKLDFESVPASEGQEIQAIGYPEASSQIDVNSKQYYAPTFSTGRISRLTPRLLQIDAAIGKGDSGGPVVSKQGKVLGVIVKRAAESKNIGSVIIESDISRFAAAINIETIKHFAPELFNKQGEQN